MKRVAPLARHPVGARRITTATPHSAQRFVRSARNRPGSFFRVNALTWLSISLNRDAFQAEQWIEALLISPCRSHAATAPAWDSNEGDVLKAALSITLRYTLYHSATSTTPKNLRHAANWSVDRGIEGSHPKWIMSFRGSARSHFSLDFWSASRSSRAKSSRYWDSRDIQKAADAPRTASNRCATWVVIVKPPRSKSSASLIANPMFWANSARERCFSSRISVIVSPGAETQSGRKSVYSAVFIRNLEYFDPTNLRPIHAT